MGEHPAAALTTRTREHQARLHAGCARGNCAAEPDALRAPVAA